MTPIAIPIAVHEPEGVERAIERCRAAARSGASIVEWRIDELAEHDDALKAIAALVRNSPLPCIVTCRPEWEGGGYHGEEHARLELFEASLSGDARPRYIDIELAAYQRSAELRAMVHERIARPSTPRDLNTSLILSTHDFQGRPRDLIQRIETMTHEPACAVIKVAWLARSLRDNLEAFEILTNRQKPTIALCMGQFGLMSRVLAPKFGGFLTFVSDTVTEVTAPGQPTIDELKKLYRFDSIGPRTHVYGVIGWPVEHSLSPAIHNAGFEAIGHDAVYLPMPIPGGPNEFEHFKATVGALIDAPSLGFRGASVTIPHKENLLRFVTERGGRVDDLAERIGAANTLIVGSSGEGGLECINTDCPAAIDALCAGMRIDQRDLRGKRIAVIGAGGAARAIVVGLLQVGAIVTVFNRTLDRATRLVQELKTYRSEFASVDATLGGILNTKPLDQIANEQFDVYINCTPVGMMGGPAPDESPLPPNVKLNDSTTVFDTVYAPARTPLIQVAEARGAKTITGIDMFIRQAAMQFEKWTGTPAPLKRFESVITIQTAADPHPS